MKIFEGRTEGTIVSPPRGKRDFGYVAPLFGIILYPSPQCCGSGMFIPDPNFFPSQMSYPIFSQPKSDPHQRIVSELSEM